jgi:hypothetical protein
LAAGGDGKTSGPAITFFLKKKTHASSSPDPWQEGGVPVRRGTDIWRIGKGVYQGKNVTLWMTAGV